MTAYCPEDSTFNSALSEHQRVVDQAALGEISLHQLYPCLIMFGANGCWHVEKCRMQSEEDNTEEDKKA